MMTNGAMINMITKFLNMTVGEAIYCLNTYCLYWLETIGLAAVVFFN